MQETQNFIHTKTILGVCNEEVSMINRSALSIWKLSTLHIDRQLDILLIFILNAVTYDQSYCKRSHGRNRGTYIFL